jgi:hypothetical protein
MRLWKYKKLSSLVIGDYDKAIELNPSNASPYSNRGNLHKAQQNYEQAIAVAVWIIEVAVSSRYCW